MRCILAGAVVLGLVAPGMSQAQVRVVDRFAPDQPALLMSHLGNNRGFLEGGYPENSLAAIDHAIELGVDGVYLPIQITRDGRYVVMHDATLNATTDVEEVFPDGPPGRTEPMADRRRDRVSDYSLDEIMQLRLTDGQDGGQHAVPLLEEALALIAGRALATLSLKTYELQSLSALLESREKENLTVFSSTNAREALEVSAATGIKAEADLGICCRKDPVAGIRMLAEMFGPDLVLVYSDTSLPSPELLTTAEDLGLRLGVFPRSEDYYLTKGNIAPWEEVLDGGATVFMTDHPSAILELLGR